MEGGPLRPEMTRGTRRILSALLAAAVALCILYPPAAPAARDVAARTSQGERPAPRDEAAGGEVGPGADRGAPEGEALEGARRRAAGAAEAPEKPALPHRPEGLGLERAAGAGGEGGAGTRGGARAGPDRPPAGGGRRFRRAKGRSGGSLVPVRPGTGTALHARLPRGGRGGCRPDHPGPGAEGGGALRARAAGRRHREEDGQGEEGRRYAPLPAGGGAAAPRRHRAGEEAQGEGAEIPSREDRPHGVRRLPGRAASEGAGTAGAEGGRRGDRRPGSPRRPRDGSRRFREGFRRRWRGRS